MTPVRPSQLPPGQIPQNDARLSAQRAFFEAVRGKATAAASPAAISPAATAARAEVRPDPAAAAPQKILRPGSMLDIRV